MFKKFKSEYYRIIIGCILSGFIFLLLLYCLVTYLHIPPQQIKLSLTEMKENLSQQNNSNKVNKEWQNKNIILPTSIKSNKSENTSFKNENLLLKKKFTNNRESQSIFFALFLLVSTWFCGIFFSSFTRRLVEKICEFPSKK